MFFVISRITITSDGFEGMSFEVMIMVLVWFLMGVQARRW